MSVTHGMVTAFVKKVDAAQGRVKVEYRDIEQGLLSPWAYIASPMSGKSRGALFMPEEGDEVLVCYGDGHFSRPYVVGFLWNGEHTSPETHAHNRVIITPGGHQLRFEDKEGDRRVVLKTDGGHKLTMDDKSGQKKLELAAASGQRKLLMDEETASAKVQVKSSMNEIVLDDAPGAAKIQIKAGAVTIVLNQLPQPSISVSAAGTTIDISATGVSLSTTAPVTVSTASSATLTSGGAVSVTAGGAVSVTAGAAASLTCTTANVTAGVFNLSAGVFNCNAPVAIFAGVVKATAIVSPIYTPGLGNMI
jgi:uncharacterized protein involved in type VI secretion and phage assembly